MTENKTKYTHGWNGKDYTKRSAEIELRKAKAHSKARGENIVWEVLPWGKPRHWEEQRYHIMGYVPAEEN